LISTKKAFGLTVVKQNLSKHQRLQCYVPESACTEAEPLGYVQHWFKWRERREECLLVVLRGD